MKSRAELIKEISQYGPEFKQAKKDIQEYPWDCKEELYLLTRKDVLGVFERFMSGELNGHHLSSWASFLEGRDDFGYEPSAEDVLSEVVFLLGNPEINYGVNADLIKKLRKKVWENQT